MNNFEIINIIGTIAFAISGYLVGFKKQLDALGVIIVALLTAIGGGMLRDILIGHIPMVFTQNTALIVIFITLLFSWFFRLQHQHKKILATWFFIADAVGLAAFSITGAQMGLQLHLNLFGVVTLSFATAVGGGIIRDVLVNDMPIILQKDFYGSIAILMSFILYLLDKINAINIITINLLFIAGLACRLCVLRFNLGLPGFQNK